MTAATVLRAAPVAPPPVPATSPALPTAAVGEALPGPSGPGQVVLEIGGQVGALVLYCPAELDRQEVEVRRAGTDWDGTHVAIRERRLPGGSRWAALFGALPEGRYETRLKGEPGPPALSVEVVGGRVASARWPGP